MLRGHLGFYIEVPNFGSVPNPSFLLMLYPINKNLGSCHSCRLSFQVQASIWPSPGCCRHLENESVGRYLFAFPINKYFKKLFYLFERQCDVIDGEFYLLAYSLNGLHVWCWARQGPGAGNSVQFSNKDSGVQMAVNDWAGPGEANSQKTHLGLPMG